MTITLSVRGRDVAMQTFPAGLRRFLVHGQGLDGASGGGGRK